jgi:hypothetical protein
MEAYPRFHRKVGKEVKELFHLKVNNGLYATIDIGMLELQEPEFFLMKLQTCFGMKPFI